LSSSSTCPEVGRRRCAVFLRLPIVVLLLSAIPALHALDPKRPLEQYVHDQWDEEKGYPGGTVTSFAETPDGYLWIGGDKGLIRFDGLTFRTFNHENTPMLPDNPVLGLTVDSQGDLWIRLQQQTVMRYRHGEFESMFPDLLAKEGVTAMDRGLGGDVLLARVADPMRYRGNQLIHIPPGDIRTSYLMIAIAETRDGSVWLGTRDAGLLHVREGNARPVKGLPDRKVNSLVPIANGGLLIGTDNGLVKWNGRDIVKDGIPAELLNGRVMSMTLDHDGNLWAGGSRGLVRLTSQGAAAVETRNYPDAGMIGALFEDREGGLWIGRGQRLERYRDRTFLTYPAIGPASSDNNGPLFVDAAARTWFGPSSGGLFWLRDTGQNTVAGLANDVVYSIDGRANELWIGSQREGLTHVRMDGDTAIAERVPGVTGSIYSVRQSRDGSIWAGSLNSGVSRLRDGRVIVYSTGNGLSSNTITAMEEDAGGTMWFATPNGLNAFANDHWSLYTGEQGLPPGRMNCLTADSSGILWIGTDAGLAFLRDGRVHTVSDSSEPLLDNVLGIADDRRGGLWVATPKHIARLPRDSALGAGVEKQSVRVFGSADGISVTEGVRRDRSVLRDPFGRVWFSLRRGISVIDTARLASRSAPAILHLESISADGNPVSLTPPIRISSARKRIRFGYVGLSLSVPDRVRYRYRLDSFDSDWSDPWQARETGYTNLGPGSYRFRLIASNSDGIWNSAEAAIDFEVVPPISQSLWFRAALLIACVLIGAASYRLRLNRLTRQLNMRFDERLAERTRIGQELHDTLMQGMLAASMQLHVAVDALPPTSPSRPQFGRVMAIMRQVIDESRNAVRGLRSTSAVSNNLEAAFSNVQGEFPGSEAINFRIIVDGLRKPLNPLIRDEAYRIGREALVNAFRHSGSPNVEMELEYDDEFRLTVRDSGRGIDEEVLRSGRDGHWGLVGMRERAERIGAELRVWSRAAAGTELKLTIPGKVAFSTQDGTPIRWWLPVWFRKRTAKRNERIE